MTPSPQPTETIAILLFQDGRDEAEVVDPSESEPHEGDAADSDNLSEQLFADRYDVRIAHTVTHARALARGSPPDLVLIRARSLRQALDLVAEIRHGEEQLGAAADTGSVRAERRQPAGHYPLHTWPARIPVVVILPRGSRIDVLRAFEAGADDCLAAPVFYLELRARIRALLERCRQDVSPRVLCAGPLTIDTASRTVALGDRRALALSRLEYELLLVLAREPRRVLARSELVRHLWGAEPPDSARTLDSHASRLRRALHAADGERWIVSVRGVGYRLR